MQAPDLNLSKSELRADIDCVATRRGARNLDAIPCGDLAETPDSRLAARSRPTPAAYPHLTEVSGGSGESHRLLEPLHQVPAGAVVRDGGVPTKRVLEPSAERVRGRRLAVGYEHPAWREFARLEPVNELGVVGMR